LNFVLQGAEVDVTDDHARKLAFFTDGRKLQKPKAKDDSYQEVAAHWSGTQLITDEKTPQGAKMSRTIELATDGRQFFETIHIDRGKSKGLLTVRYVYDVSTGHDSELTHETDPNQPVMKRRSDDGNASTSPGTPNGQGSDPDQPTMKRRSDDSSTPSTPSDTTTSTPQNPQPDQTPDPDQPVMKRRSGGQ
jgi:hypothetical protein